jgi:hypothetical protein
MQSMEMENDPRDIASVDGRGDDNAKNLRENLPEIATNIDEVDSMIAKQMMKLSVEDREKVYNEMVLQRPRKPSNRV